MKLLIVTQAVDREDPNLGAFYYWFEELARQCERVVILAARAGDQALPPNTEIHTFAAATRPGRLWKFWELFSRDFVQSDAVLFHMIPEFVLAASPFLIARRRPSALWYAHKSVTPALKIAERLVRYVFTSSADGFRIPSKKVLWLGQAINTEFFVPSRDSTSARAGLRMISVGRIAPVKNYEVLLDAAALMKNDSRPWSLDIVGGPMLSRDREYLVALQRRAAETGLAERVRFLGPRHYSEIPSLLNQHDIFINLSSTGSLDKAVLEAMSCGLTVITANEAYRSILPPRYFLQDPDPASLVSRIRECAGETRPNETLRRIVEEHHGLDKTMEKIIAVLSAPNSQHNA
ncbi:MAG: glycosyltransferase family 4 protein [Candidatus Sungbacteria bacterium]|uniref:Glycosyltransferase family 4 protein n=1 Tax=Candidatus Sungiibacteriota bacterium TaxID=2750080 RepID=A0A932R2F5_9BACT|nr:glycosyltransferase family 4 protein [Candidatus Sungbacteria bacterium]